MSEDRCKHMVGEAISPTNLEKGCADKPKKNCRPSKDALTVDKNMHENMAPDEPHRLAKINLYRIIYST